MRQFSTSSGESSDVVPAAAGVPAAVAPPVAQSMFEAGCSFLKQISGLKSGTFFHPGTCGLKGFRSSCVSARRAQLRGARSMSLQRLVEF